VVVVMQALPMANSHTLVQARRMRREDAGRPAYRLINNRICTVQRVGASRDMVQEVMGTIITVSLSKLL